MPQLRKLATPEAKIEFLRTIAQDLERKLRDFRDYFNHSRVHASLSGATPVCSTDLNVIALDNYRGELTAAGCMSCLRLRDAQFATHTT